MKNLRKIREQESPDEKITFPSDIDPEVFYELPEEVQKELLADWKRTGSDFTLYINERAPKKGKTIFLRLTVY